MVQVLLGGALCAERGGVGVWAPHGAVLEDAGSKGIGEGPVSAEKGKESSKGFEKENAEKEGDDVGTSMTCGSLLAMVGRGIERGPWTRCPWWLLYSYI